MLQQAIVVNLNTSGQTFNSYPLLTFGSLNGFSSSDFTIGSGAKAGYTYGFVQDGSNPNQIDLTITGTGSGNNLPTRQSLNWAVGSGTWNIDRHELGRQCNLCRRRHRDIRRADANNSTVTISGSAVSPQSLTISNISNSYNITGGSIAGTTSLIKTGAGLATLSNSNTYTGGTSITGGTWRPARRAMPPWSQFRRRHAGHQRHPPVHHVQLH